MSWINVLYVIYWGIVSFVATFMYILDGEWSKILTADLAKEIFSPLFIWIAAFFADYLYNIFTMNKSTQILDLKWTKASYFIIELIFVILIAGIHWTNDTGRTITIMSLFLCMLGLKAASLSVVCPLTQVEKA